MQPFGGRYYEFRNYLDNRNGKEVCAMDRNEQLEAAARVRLTQMTKTAG